MPNNGFTSEKMRDAAELGLILLPYADDQGPRPPKEMGRKIVRGICKGWIDLGQFPYPGVWPQDRMAVRVEFLYILLARAYSYLPDSNLRKQIDQELKFIELEESNDSE